MDTNNNNKIATVVLHDLRSQEEKDKTRHFDMNVKDTPYTAEKNRKQRALITFLSRLYNHYDVIEVENWNEKTGKKQSAAQYASKHIVICPSTSLLAKSEVDNKYLTNLLYKAISNQEKADKCDAICKRGECDCTCKKAVRPYCPHRDANGYDLRLQYGRPEVRVYSFHETKTFTLCSDVLKPNLSTVDFWYKIVQNEKQRYTESQKLIRDNKRLDELLQTSTPWLGYDNLKTLLDDCGNSWELFMDIINNTTDLIQSEGIWDVEVGFGVNSLQYSDGSVMFITNKSENGSVAVVPRRQVYVKNPKTKLFDTTLDCDKITLFLSLTFYKYAGIKPMLPVVQVSNGDGTVDYKVDYSADRYFGEDVYDVDEDMDIADLTYLANYEDEEDTEDSESEDESDEEEFPLEDDSDVDTEVDWNKAEDEDDYDFKISEFTGTHTSVSLLVTDDREVQEFNFKINYFDEYTPVKTVSAEHLYGYKLQHELRQYKEKRDTLSRGAASTPVITSKKKVPVEERLSWVLSDYSYYWMMMNKAKYKFEFEEYLDGFYKAMNSLKKINARYPDLVDIQVVSTENGISRAALQELINKFN